MSRSFLDMFDGRENVLRRIDAFVVGGMEDAADVMLISRDRLRSNLNNGCARLVREAVTFERWRLAQRLRSLMNRRRCKRKSPEPTIPA